MNKTDKWVDEYIKNIDINNIEWKSLNAIELYNFFQENYLDKNLCEYVHDNTKSLYLQPLGMHYLTFDSPVNEQDYNFFLGLVNNSINKKTIVGAIIYSNTYYLFSDQTIPYTYILSVEINYYFRNMGLFKIMSDNFYNYVNPNQHILTTKESELGKQCRALEIFKEIFKNKGFNNLILEDQGYLTQRILYNNQYKQNKVLKK